ncbi:hypothetical protein KEM48_003396 [Puccinia striiformis f. sp. tritici PST-130]|nr:hypothetical protein KEM48_003396 [Puccinia striiformis f. sp. tritici PST-130]
MATPTHLHKGVELTGETAKMAAMWNRLPGAFYGPAVGLDRNLWGLTIGKLLSKLRNEPPGAGSKNQIRQPESPAYILWEQGKSE